MTLLGRNPKFTYCKNNFIGLKGYMKLNSVKMIQTTTDYNQLQVYFVYTDKRIIRKLY